ncbi:MAG: hypothetical protein AVDCRST_MAG19-2434 [uncultured Thermomicrobiales bacterium]|uniref:Uncharacterized protein n=1 Tax=uncultured Thermomicrobiales bacterium TaxID=1645740 RepID=A0A6J4V3R2_9BACT|nr:MAG: hypothetical protein AVDCRST_MAG19-2434 [uncultured Thermomicrobiales bacterium]
MRSLGDGSLLLRFTIPSPHPAGAVDVIVSAALGGAFELLLPSEPATEPTGRLVTGPYMVTRAIPRRAGTFLARLVERAIPLPFPPLTRDPKDNPLLADARRDRAHYLATGARDLLVPAPDFVRGLRERGPDHG